jgi:hypothetical protein
MTYLKEIEEIEEIAERGARYLMSSDESDARGKLLYFLDFETESEHGYTSSPERRINILRDILKFLKGIKKFRQGGSLIVEKDSHSHLFQLISSTMATINDKK